MIKKQSIIAYVVSLNWQRFPPKILAACVESLMLYDAAPRETADW